MKNRNNSRIRRKHTRSLTWICVMQFLTVALISMLIYTVFIFLADQKMSDAYPSADDAVGYSRGIRKDEWSGFRRKYPNARMIVFDENGACLWASDEEMKNMISYEDMELISVYGADDYYSVTYLENEEQYFIFHMENDENRQNAAESYSLLDRNYRILKGNLFPDKNKLSEHEMQLLRGTLTGEDSISRYTYNNEYGDSRTLVFAAPMLTEKAYDRIVRESEHYRMFSLLLILLTIVIGTLRLRRKIRSNVDPVIDSIRRFAADGAEDEELAENVTEFRIIGDEIRRLMEKLEEAQAKQKSEEQERRRVTASLSHDLKTPISVIVGYTQAFRDNRIPEDQRDDYYVMLANKARLAADLIDSMSEYARTEHPDFKPQLESTELGEFVRQYLMSVYNELTESHIDLYPEIEEVPMYAMVDRRMFIRVLANLISNTRKYNPGGVRLRIDVRPMGGYICLRVEDDGIGIEPELRDAIFHPFVTSNEARTSGQGTGLGLAIVERTVRAHGGIIELVDAETEGYTTEFRILIPRASADR